MRDLPSLFNKRSLVDALAMEGDDNIAFEPARMDLRLRDAQVEAECLVSPLEESLGAPPHSAEAPPEVRPRTPDSPAGHPPAPGPSPPPDCPP